MKKILLFTAAFVLVAGILTGCGQESRPDIRDKERLSIVTTIFPEYDWVRNILGDNPADAELSMLISNGVDLHSYQPTAEDILKLGTCDIFIYTGGESERWIEDALKEALNRDMTVICLMDVLGTALKEEEIVEGMEEAEESEEDSEGEEIEYDEHIWLSLSNAVLLTEHISKALQEVDPVNAEVYRSNTEAYADKLNKLDAEYRKVRASSPVSVLVFGDRFPFRYMTDDYDLDYYAAFPGCYAETEASFETVTFLAGKVDELSLNAVLTIEGSDHRIAETIIQNTKDADQKLLTMDSMQSTTDEEIKEGKTYLSVMEKNLSVLSEALE